MVGLFQVLTVIVGMLTVRIILKMSGYPDDITLKWNPGSIFLRNSGIVLLLFPILWAPLAIAAGSHPAYGRAATLLNVAGGIILAVLFLFCCWACTNCYTRPLLILN